MVALRAKDSIEQGGCVKMSCLSASRIGRLTISFPTDNRKRVGPIFLGAFASVAMFALPLSTYGQDAPKKGALGRILELLQDEKLTADKKCGALLQVRGTLSAEEAESLAGWLEKADGRLFPAIAAAMNRCGAEAKALSVSTGIVARADSPVDQWAAAMGHIEYSWAGSPQDPQSRRILKQAVASLLQRLRRPLPKDQLVAVLMARPTVWHVGNVWILDEEVFKQLCTLLRDDSQEVRREAAMVLAQTPDLERFSSDSILALVDVMIDASPPDPVVLDDLLRRLLGTEPDEGTPESIRQFWVHWREKEAKGFRLTLYTLERARSSTGMSLGERQLLARQILFSSPELPREDCAKVWRALLKVFQQDSSPPRERCAAWLYPLILMASREECNEVRGEAVSLLTRMSQDKDPVLREKAMAQIGNLPGTTQPGSLSREILDRVFLNAKARPEERAVAGWSLRQAAKGEPELVERMIGLAEAFQRLPDDAFTSMTRSRCIGLLGGALIQATGKEVSLDPSEWRKTLTDFLPPKK